MNAATTGMPLEGKQIVAVACFDSFAKTAITMLATCRRQGAKTSLHLLELPGRRLSRRQRVEIQRIDPKTKLVRQSWKDLKSFAQTHAKSSDALILALDGQRSRQGLQQLHAAWENLPQRPLLVSAYPGIVLRHQLEGMLDRSGVDLLCLNSAEDHDTYVRGCKALGIDSSNAVVTGLPILWGLKERPTPQSSGTIVFFEQPSIPGNPLQRRYLCEQLQQLAKALPNNLVILKPRTSSVESTLHRRHGEMSRLIVKMAKRTPNLQLSMQPASRLLHGCGCAITVSSTAALEAMAMGVSTRIVADLGITETLGNHFFSASGAVANFEAITADPFQPSHDQLWLSQNGCRSDGAELFLSALLRHLQEPIMPEPSGCPGPPGWGSQSWQQFALDNGGRTMLSSSGVRSAQRKRHHTRSLMRRARDRLIGFGLLEHLWRGR